VTGRRLRTATGGELGRPFVGRRGGSSRAGAYGSALAVVGSLLLTALVGIGSGMSRVASTGTPVVPTSGSQSPLSPAALVFEAAQSIRPASPDPEPVPWTCHGLRALGTPACGGGPAPVARTSPSGSSTGWSKVTSAVHPGPQASYDFEMTYDAADGYLILLGATSTGVGGGQGPTEMWTYVNGNWTQLHPVRLPQNCEGSALAFDDADGYVVYLGGPNWGYPGTNCTSANQTWTYHAGAWTHLHPASTPLGRFGAAFTNDSADHQMLLFGGMSASCSRSLCGDTWAFKAGNWTKLSPKLSPTPRAESGMAYDAADGYVLLFGGVDGSTTPPGLNDSWNFSNGNWTQLHPAFSPPGPEPDAFSYDAVDHEIVYTTARNWSSGRAEITATYRAGVWKMVTGPAPVERLSAETAFDYHGGYLLFFGGLGATNMADYWSFRAGNWTDLSDLGPEPRSGQSMAYDAADGVVLLFGGTGNGRALSDTWTYAAGRWVELGSPIHPAARADASMAYDPVLRAVVLFGGSQNAGRTYLHDTWSFSGGTWSRLTPGTHPPGRTGAGMAYDAADSYLLLFGGTVAGAQRNDSWSFTKGNWAAITPSVSPAPRSALAMTYDAKDGYVVMFGGYLKGAALNDTWTFVGGRWTNLNLSFAPSGRFWSGSTFDARHGYVLLFGGTAGAHGATFGDTWAFRSGSWTLLNLSHAPLPRFAAGLAYDTVLREAVLFGGLPVVGARAFPDTWLFH